MAQRWQPGSPSSFDGAAQPSSRRGGAEQPTFTQLPDDTSELTVGFYNVGIQLQEVRGKHWPKKEQTLKQDIVKAFMRHELHMLCLSELGELNKWMSELLADSAVQPVSIYAGAHYLTIVKDEHVKVDQYHLISGFGDQKERSFQHLQVRPHGYRKLVSVINCHAPSSKRRELTAARRSSYLKAFHAASGANPFIWGGDFNTGPVQLTALLKAVDRRYVIDDAETSSAEQPGMKFAHEFWFNKLARIVATSTGCYEAATALPRLEKMEAFLEIIQEQRALHLRRHPEMAADSVFSEAHMKEIHSTWMNDHHSWMKADKLREYEQQLASTHRGAPQQAHQTRRSAFSAYLFQVLGNRHILLACIQHPICSAVQPV